MKHSSIIFLVLLWLVFGSLRSFAESDLCPANTTCSTSFSNETMESELDLGIDQQPTATASPTSNRPPTEYALPAPGVYLYTDGNAVPLPNLGNIHAGSTLPIYLPQTTSRQPVVLVWSPDIAPFGVTLSSFSGNVLIAIEARDNYIAVTNSNVFGVDPGATLWSVNGTPVGASVELAYALLSGEAGSTVEVTFLIGTERKTLPLVRQPVERRNHELSMDFWDDRTVLFTTDYQLSLGTYCLSTGTDWCFQVVTEIQPMPTTTPTLVPPPSACAMELGVVTVTSTRLRLTPEFRGSIITELPMGTVVTALAKMIDEAYLYVRLEDGTEGWVANQSISLENRFALLPAFSAPTEVNCLTPSVVITTSTQAAPELLSAMPPTAEGSSVIIRNVLNTGDIATEAVEIQNNGPTIDLHYWTISDSDGNVYTFAQQRLFAGSRIILNTRAGQNTPVVLFWGLNEPAWEREDIVVLRDSNGIAQSAFRITGRD